MIVESTHRLCSDSGQYVDHGALIYDMKDGSFVGAFFGFTGANIVIKSNPRGCNVSDQFTRFPLECLEHWTVEPLPTKPPHIWPESLRRFFRAAHKSEDPKQIALALKAVDLWTRDEIVTVLDDIPF